jgi:hypothetical protein
VSGISNKALHLQDFRQSFNHFRIPVCHIAMANQKDFLRIEGGSFKNLYQSAFAPRTSPITRVLPKEDQFYRLFMILTE